MDSGNREVPVSLSDEERLAPALAFYRQQIELPSSVNNSVPKWVDSSAKRWLFDTVLPKLGLGRVYCEKLEIDGKVVYHLRQSVFFTSSHIYLVPVAAYYLGSALIAMHRMGMCESAQFGDEGRNRVYIPAWAHDDVMAHFSSICKEHHDLIVSVVQEVGRLVQSKDEEDDAVPFLGTTSSENKPTIH